MTFKIKETLVDTDERQTVFVEFEKPHKTRIIGTFEYIEAKYGIFTAAKIEGYAETSVSAADENGAFIKAYLYYVAGAKLQLDETMFNIGELETDKDVVYS